MQFVLWKKVQGVCFKVADPWGLTVDLWGCIRLNRILQLVNESGGRG